MKFVPLFCYKMQQSFVNKRFIKLITRKTGCYGRKQGKTTVGEEMMGGWQVTPILLWVFLVFQCFMYYRDYCLLPWHPVCMVIDLINLCLHMIALFCRKHCKMYFKQYHNNCQKSTEDVTLTMKHVTYKCIFLIIKLIDIFPGT